MQRLRNLSLVDFADNPCTRSEFTLYGESFTLDPIDAEELETFKAQFGAILSMPGSEERRVMLDRLDIYVIAMRAIKHELNGPKFAGLNAGDTELGMGIIRPQFTRAAAAYKTSWSVAITTSWADWFYETSGNGYAVGKDFGLVITHLKSLITPEPFLAEARFKVSRIELLPHDARMIKVGDNENGIAVVAIPSMILKPKSTFYSRLKGDTAGTDHIALGGLIYGLGRSIKEETATWTA